MRVWWGRVNAYHNPYDKQGNFVFLLDRPADPAQSGVAGVTAEIRDESLAMLCECFGIPKRQMHCMRADDELMELYRNIVGPRFWDDCEFEELALRLDQLPGEKLGDTVFERISTVGDLFGYVAERRATLCNDERSEPTV